MRPAELTDGREGRGLRRMTEPGEEPQPTTVSRASVAGFLVSLVSDRSYDGKEILISKA